MVNRVVEYYRLSTLKKNQVFELIKKHNLQPSNFKWKLVKSASVKNQKVNRLVYIGKAYFFQFDYKPDNLGLEHICSFCPNEFGDKGGGEGEDWDSHLLFCDEWLTHLSEEVGQPNLWDEIEKFQTPPDLKPYGDIPNDLLNATEASHVSGIINQIREYLDQVISLNEEQHIFVNAQLDYLIQASKKQGRKDWFYTCIGVVVTIATGLALAPEQTKTIWQLIKTALTGIIQLYP